MSKTLKKILSIVLVVVMMMSFAAISLATDGSAAEVVEHEHRFISEILLDIVMEIWGMIRYIFYDVFLGVPA